jgi:hypothetical protein
MFSPAHTDEDLVEGAGHNLGDSSRVTEVAAPAEEAARTKGTVGHAQKAARARDDDGTPKLLRRDFNTTDGDFPGIHFVTHQRSPDEFVRVREAMAGEDLAGSGVGQSHNNGILQYIFVNRRGNFLVPPRASRSLPALESP